MDYGLERKYLALVLSCCILVEMGNKSIQALTKTVSVVEESHDVDFIAQIDFSEVADVKVE